MLPSVDRFAVELNVAIGIDPHPCPMDASSSQHF
jgi:hypothetical protein